MSRKRQIRNLENDACINFLFFLIHKVLGKMIAFYCKVVENFNGRNCI